MDCGAGACRLRGRGHSTLTGSGVWWSVPDEVSREERDVRFNMASSPGTLWGGGGGSVSIGSGVGWTSRDTRAEGSVGGGVPCGSHSRGTLGGVPPVLEGEAETVGRLPGRDSSEDVVPEQESVEGVEGATSEGGGEGSGTQIGERLRLRLVKGGGGLCGGN